MFPLEYKKRTYAYILTQNIGHSLLLAAITQKNLDVLDGFYESKYGRLGVNGNHGQLCIVLLIDAIVQFSMTFSIT